MSAWCKGSIGSIIHGLNGLLDSAGKEPLVMIHVDANNVGKSGYVVLEGKCKLLGRKLKSGPPRWPSQNCYLFDAQDHLEKHKSGVSRESVWCSG